MEWTPSFQDSSLRTSSPIDLVFKPNGAVVAQRDNSRILETVNRAAHSWAGSEYYRNGLIGYFDSSGTHSVGILDLDQIRPSPAIKSVKPQLHLSCAREVLDIRRRIAEKSQDKLCRMGKKRKIHDEGAEIRKIIDRPTKRQCDEKTRNIGLLSELDVQSIASEIALWKISQPPSILASHKRLMPPSQVLVEASLCDEEFNKYAMKGSANGRTNRKSPLSQCYTLVP